MPHSNSQGSEIETTRRAPAPFSLESFKRQTSTKPSNVPLPSSSTRRPPQVPYVRKRPENTGQNIAKIDNNASHSIRAAHTILDPAAIIKELIENALDARATRIHVRVRGKGALDSITISDNGQGISASDYQSLCLPSTTSKIVSFGDLERLSTFGFRGEALSAICAIAKSTTVTTRTADDTVATALKYSNDGSLASQNATARPVGTTVQVENVFHALPVRQKDAIKNHTREVSRCVAVVQALALISVNTRIEMKIGGELKVGNLPSMKEPDVIPSSLGKVCLSALRCNAKSVLGARAAKVLIEVSTDRAAVVKVPPSVHAVMRSDGHADSENNLHKTAAYGCHGLVSKASLEADGSGGRAKSTYQYIFVNRRPVDFPRLTRTIKELYRRATGMNSAAPVVILNLVLPAWSCDVNLAPDKRVVCVHEEDTLISGIVSFLEDMWIPTKITAIPLQRVSSLTYMIKSSRTVASGDGIGSQPADDLQMVDIPDEPAVEDFTDLPQTNEDAEDPALPGRDRRIDADNKEREDTPEPPSDRVRRSPNAEERATQKKHTVEPIEVTPEPSEREPSATPPGADLLSFSPVRAEEGQPQLLKEKSPVRSVSQRRRSREFLMNASTKGSATKNVSSFIARRSRSFVPAKRPRSAKFTWPAPSTLSGGAEDEGKGSEGPRLQENEIQSADAENIQSATVLDEPRTEPEGAKAIAVLDVDWDQICEPMTEASNSGEKPQDSTQEGDGQTFKDATICDIETEIVNEAGHRAAENEMSRLFNQEWFNDFQILGQFNRGFIITRLGKDLFIIDQHASDEKYNFEDLQRNTVISKQSLVQPLGLEFSAQDELLVAQHLGAFRAGGFDIEYRENNPPTRRLFLKAQPISKHTIFVQDDLRDIVDMLKSNVVQSSSMKITVLRPPRIRAMFASRACRKSIMIGTALQKPQMVKVVRNLATLEHPWTCPHGRPTMRHLCSLPS